MPFDQRPQIPPATVSNVAQLATLAKDTPVTSISGTISNLGRRNEGSGKYGPYSFQDATLTDSSGSIPLTFGNLPDQAHLNGQSVTFMLGRTGRGVSVIEKENYRSHQLEKILKIDGKNATIVPGQIVQSAVATATSHQQMPIPAQLPPTQTATGSLPTQEDVTKARGGIAQIANLYILCGMAANYIDGKLMEETGEKFTPETLQKTTACLFIEANKKGLGARLPVDDISGYIPERAVN
jgi:hypothetical protein